MMEADDEDEDEEKIDFDNEAEKDGEDFTKDMEHDQDEMGDDEPASKSDVMNLADKLDELMADFEDMMGGGDMGDNAGMEDDGMDGMDGGGMGMDDDEFETEGMMETIDLKAAPKPVTSEPAGTNTRSTTAFNSGAAGTASHPVKMTGDTAKGRPAPTAKEMPDYQGNGHYGKPGAAPKAVTTQAAGVNTRTPFPKGK